jgi:hypothetical protein
MLVSWRGPHCCGHGDLSPPFLHTSVLLRPGPTTSWPGFPPHDSHGTSENPGASPRAPQCSAVHPSTRSSQSSQPHPASLPLSCVPCPSHSS